MGHAYTCSGSECGWRTDRQSHARQSVSRSGQYVARLYSLHLEREIGMRAVNARRTGCVGDCHRAKVCRCVRSGCNVTGLLTRSWAVERIRINVRLYCGIQWWEGIKEKNRNEERRKEENEDGKHNKNGKPSVTGR